ncbi:MAG: hypothetical protein DRI46_13420 [Chloroflexi bacterium]|nr:MAG: hypothetical protein DRI46_13420 [Chloroflexota bacterium]
MTHPYPDYLVVGMMRAGTSTIYEQITRHPRTIKAFRKELHFLTRDITPLPAEALMSMEYFEQLGYDSARPRQITGEASPSYIVVPKRILAFNPECRAIVMVRDPAERALSQYRHAVKSGSEDRSVAAAFAGLGASPYVGQSRYAKILAEFLRHYPADQVLVMSLEAYLEDTQEAMDVVYEFLGAQPVRVDPTIHGAPAPASRDDRGDEVLSRLREVFAKQRGAMTQVLARAEVNTYPGSKDYFGRY